MKAAGRTAVFLPRGDGFSSSGGEGRVRITLPALPGDPPAPPFPPKLCLVPGCGTPLNQRTVSGVCAAHNHHPVVCRCDLCQGKARKPGAR